MVAAFALEIKHGIDHVLDHSRAGDLAFLGDVTDQHDGSARALGITDHLLCRAPHLRYSSRRGLRNIGPKRLDGV